MKKALFSLVAIAAFSAASYAQLSGGIRAGLNLSNQKFSFAGESDSGDLKAGLLVGLYLTGNISDNVAIQPELVYSSFGAGDPDGDLKMGYISIPILLRYNFNEMVNLHLGPQFGILASADFDGQDVKDGYKGLDVGAAVGVGVDLGAFNAGLRYYFGLSNVAESVDGFDIEAKNSAIQVVVGYRLFGGE